MKDDLVSMIADTAVMATEQHLEVLTLIKGQSVEIAGMRASIDQVKADLSGVKADVALVKADVALVKADVASVRVDVAIVNAKVDQVKADVSSIRAKLVASDVAAEKRHDELLDAIRSMRGVKGVSFAM